MILNASHHAGKKSVKRPADAAIDLTEVRTNETLLLTLNNSPAKVDCMPLVATHQQWKKSHHICECFERS